MCPLSCAVISFKIHMQQLHLINMGVPQLNHHPAMTRMGGEGSGGSSVIVSAPASVAVVGHKPFDLEDPPVRSQV